MEKEEKSTAGQEFIKSIRPIGCALFLLTSIAVFLICLTSGNNPIPGYEAPESTGYYSQHIEELQNELEENVFPELEGIKSCDVDDGKLKIVIDEENFAVSRSAILHYFDSSLFTIKKSE